jgi:8-oxo-dGTP diphosphatase
MSTPPATSIPKRVIGVQKASVTYTTRHSVRLIIRNRTNNTIAILHAQRENYYKLPGGGVEGSETHFAAAKREALEETGSEIKLDSDPKRVAIVEEWRNDLHQFSHLYSADLTEDTGRVELEEDEIEDGLKHEWVSVDDALVKMRGANPESEFGKSIKERDIFFVETFAQATN